MARISSKKGGIVMSAFSTDILLEKSGGKKQLLETSQQAKVLLAKNILHRIADSAYNVNLLNGEQSHLEDALALIELRCLDLADDWRRKPHSEAGKEFCEYCSLAFDIRRALPDAPSPEEQLKNTLRLAMTGVLGDRNVDIRRFLNENEKSCFCP